MIDGELLSSNRRARRPTASRSSDVQAARRKALQITYQHMVNPAQLSPTWIEWGASASKFRLRASAETRLVTPRLAPLERTRQIALSRGRRTTRPV